MPRRAAFVFNLVVPCAALACAAFPWAARAAPATPEEAGRLTALFETYIGKPAPGAPASVVVTPEGDSYKASFDLARVAAPLHGFGIDVVAAAPYVTTLTPLPDGTWRVRRGPFPPFGFTTKKGLSYSVELTSASSDAIFDPKLQALTHSETELGGNKTSVTLGDRSQRTEITEKGKQVLEASGPSANDVSATLRQTDTDIKYSARTEVGSAAADPMGPLAVTLASAETRAVVAHQKGAALLDLWAFLVAHPARGQLVADQAELKRRALALIPYASAFDVRTDAKDMVADSAKGGARIASLSEAVAYDSGKSDQGLAFSFGVKGLKVLVPNLPDWITALIPTSLDLNLATSPVDMGQALRVLIEGADLSKDDPISSEVVDKALAALAPNGGPTYKLKPSTIANDTIGIAASGEFGSGGTGKARIEAKGLDEEIALIAKAAAEDPTAAQAVQMLAVAKALAAPGPDGRLVWNIEMGPNSLTVNGKPLR